MSTSDIRDDSPYPPADGQPAVPTRTGAGRQRRWSRSVIALTGCIGVIVSLGMFLAIENWQTRVAALRFFNRASEHLQTMNSGLQDATDLLYSIRAYFESLDHVPSRTEFQAFSAALRVRVPGLRDTGWAPRVTAAERDAFEQRIQASGLPDFQIIERNPEGKLARAVGRATYFPILYSEPGAPNRPVMGFDIASESLRNRAIAHAIATDQPAATPPVKLMNMARPNGGMMSFIPVRAKRPAGDGGPDEVGGVVLGAFETTTMIENILATKVHLTGVDMYVFDPDAASGQRLIYWHSTRGGPAPTEASLLARLHWLGTLDLVDQHWGAILTPSDPTEAGPGGRTALIVLLAGLSMTALLVLYLYLSHRRTQQLEQLTTDLRKAGEELRRSSAELDHLARHDVLTGLANRMGFRETLGRCVRDTSPAEALAVLYLDLDRFKAVNDTLGHPAGDHLLCEVAERLRASVRGKDSITRLGGDEFAIAQADGDQPAAAQRLARRLIETLSQPYHIEGQWVVIGASVGIVVTTDPNTSVDELLHCADMALYRAKHDGRGTWRLFADDMEQEAQRRRSMEIELRRALERNELVLYYQPQVRIADGQICGMEALLRWRHPVRGLLTPGDFMKCAEDAGLIQPIGAWVLRTVLGESAGWPSHIRVAVNLSPHELTRGDLLQTIQAALAEFDQPAARLELEITEHALSEQPAAGQAALRRLQGLGVRICMDNFGIGSASLSQLRGFPFDRMKVDRSLVAGIIESPRGSAIAQAVLQLATTLNIVSLAEGVETQAQLEQLAAFGCDEAQGMLFAAPRPASVVPGLLANWRPVLPHVPALPEGRLTDQRLVTRD